MVLKPPIHAFSRSLLMCRPDEDKRLSLAASLPSSLILAIVSTANFMSYYLYGSVQVNTSGASVCGS